MEIGGVFHRCQSRDLVLAECTAGDAGPNKNPEGQENLGMKISKSLLRNDQISGLAWS